MIGRGLTIGAVLAVAGIATVSSANEAFEKAVKARQGLFQVYAFNIGQLGAMAKGAVEYDAKVAQTAADNLAAAASIDGSAMWPQGTDNAGVMKGKTRALPAAWTTYPKVAEKHEDLVAAVANLQASAGGGLDALKGSIGDVGKACKSCHDDFRAKDF